MANQGKANTLRFPALKSAGGTLLRGVVTCALALALGNAQAAGRPTERSKQKAEAEAQRAGIQQKLTALKKDISRTESEKDDAADELSESEEAISNANRSLHELADEQSATNAKLQDLAAQQEHLGKPSPRKSSSWPSCCVNTMSPATRTASSCCCPATTRTASTATCR